VTLNRFEQCGDRFVMTSVYFKKDGLATRVIVNDFVHTDGTVENGAYPGILVSGGVECLCKEREDTECIGQFGAYWKDGCLVLSIFGGVMDMSILCRDGENVSREIVWLNVTDIMAPATDENLDFTFACPADDIEEEASTTDQPEECPEGTYSIGSKVCACLDDATNQQYLPADDSFCMSSQTTLPEAPTLEPTTSIPSSAPNPQPSSSPNFSDPAEYCDASFLDRMTSDAESIEECSSAIEHGFNSDAHHGIHSNCDCFDALGEDYRKQNFDCLLDAVDEYHTLLYVYEDRCMNRKKRTTTSLPTKEPTNIETPPPVPIPENTEFPTSIVTFTMKISMVSQEYETYKETIKTEIANQLGVSYDFLTVSKINQRRRSRRLLSEVILETSVQTDDYARIKSSINHENFSSDLSKRLSASTGIDVTVSDVSKALTEEIDDDSGKVNMTWLYIIIGVASFLLLLIYARRFKDVNHACYRCITCFDCSWEVCVDTCCAIGYDDTSNNGTYRGDIEMTTKSLPSTTNVGGEEFDAAETPTDTLAMPTTPFWSLVGSESNWEKKHKRQPDDSTSPEVEFDDIFRDEDYRAVR